MKNDPKNPTRGAIPVAQLDPFRGRVKYAVDQSRPTDRQTAGSLRIAAAVVYLVVIAVAFATGDGMFAAILTTGIPVIVSLVVLADLLDRGGRVR